MKRRYSKPFDRSMYLLDYMYHTEKLMVSDVMSGNLPEPHVTKAQCAYVLECSLPTAINSLEMLVAWGMVESLGQKGNGAEHFQLTQHGYKWYQEHTGYCCSGVNRHQRVLDHNRKVENNV